MTYEPTSLATSCQSPTGYQLCTSLQGEEGSGLQAPRMPHTVLDEQIADCFQSLYAASIELRSLAQLNQARAHELQKHATCLELVSLHQQQ